ncbi:MAG: hypothetical protein M0Q49_01635 [Porticoccaceae bacterium]|nr:hypothetical protein [Porticoccaceae bacterium]
MARSGGSYVVDKDGTRRRVQHTTELTVLERKALQAAEQKPTKAKPPAKAAADKGEHS